MEIMDHMRQIPVFVFPTNLKFYLGSRQNYKQMLTIYNPYEFKIRYKGTRFLKGYLQLHRAFSSMYNSKQVYCD